MNNINKKINISHFYKIIYKPLDVFTSIKNKDFSLLWLTILCVLSSALHTLPFVILQNIRGVIEQYSLLDANIILIISTACISLLVPFFSILFHAIILKFVFYCVQIKISLNKLFIIGTLSYVPFIILKILKLIGLNYLQANGYFVVLNLIFGLWNVCLWALGVSTLASKGKQKMGFIIVIALWVIVKSLMYVFRN